MSTKGHIMKQETKDIIGDMKRVHDLPQLKEAFAAYHKKLMEDPAKLPTIGGFCLEAGISQQNILEYTTKYPEVGEIINYILELQQEFCLVNGIKQKINPIFAMFLLKAKHNFKDNPQNLTQNNYMNISPDVLKDALQLMGKTNKTGK